MQLLCQQLFPMKRNVLLCLHFKCSETMAKNKRFCGKINIDGNILREGIKF